MTNSTKDAWVWDQYWHGNRVALCFDAQQNQYRDELAGDWREWFSDFADGAKLLDLCTGNGALPLLALDAATSSGRSFSITGVDYADIDPARWLEEEAERAAKITFMGGVNVTRLPFENGSFQGVSSQYGIEYSDLSRTLPEAARVLAKGGRGRFVLHASEGTTAAEAQTEVERIEQFMDKSRLFEAAEQSIKARLNLRGQPLPPPKLMERARKADTKLKAALERSSGFFGSSRDDFVRHTVSYVKASVEATQNKSMEKADLEKQLAEIRSAILAHRGRLKALTRAAVDEAGAADISSALEDLGLVSTTAEPVRIAGGRQVGWLVSFSKPD